MKIINAIKFVIIKTWQASKTYFLLYFTVSIFLGLLYTIYIFFYSAIIDTATGVKSYFGLGLLGVIFVRLIYEIGTNTLAKLQEYIWNLLDIKQAIYNNQDFIRRLSKLDIPTFEDPMKNDSIWRTFNRFQLQFKYYFKSFVELVSRLSGLAVNIAIFFIASPVIAIIVFITHLIPIILKAKIGEYTFLIYRADSETRRKFEYLNSALCSRDTLPEIKMFHAFDFFRARLVAIYKQFTRKQLGLFRKAWIISTFVELLPTLAIFLFLFVTANQVINKEITAGTFVFLYINVFVFSSGLTQVMTLLEQLSADSHFIQDAMDFYNLKSVIAFPNLSKKEELTLIRKLSKPNIVFNHVSFAYPSKKDKSVLKDLNLTIPYGQNIALIGENGAGKSTLVKLLMRLYDPTEGSISINNVDIREIPERILLLLYSTLFQSYGKFYLTIRENLDMASNGNGSDEEYEKILKLSNAWNFVRFFPKGLDQQLGPHFKDGIDLSGGQWQQLAIAKAYAKKASILILDEPTSAIDAKSEIEIFDRLNRETKENTVIFISHRFSTIRDAERIIVLDRGKIIEDGTHDLLMKKKGKYESLYTSQAERYYR